MKLQSVTLIAAIFANNALAAPSDLALAPRGSTLEKRQNWVPYQEFPPYVGEFKPWKHVGCWSSEVWMPFDANMCSCQNSPDKQVFSIEKCMAACKGGGFRYAGIKGENSEKKCYCASGVSEDTKNSNLNKCSIPCDEDPCYKDFDASKALDKYIPIGCFYFYAGVILSEQSNVSGDNLSIESCLESCVAKGVAYVALTASGPAIGQGDSGNQCWCGGKIAPRWAQRHKDNPGPDANMCTTLCSATAKVQGSISKDDYQYCGNAWYASIYYNSDLDFSDTCDWGETTSLQSTSKATSSAKAGAYSVSTAKSTAKTTSTPAKKKKNPKRSKN
ncbi:hypothetical protein H072_4974 [Dactylellina haptotyla CBS 200.50]|uniref:WSC domain-containing protein n=1 Tax=Dactylellina haptotyla (strain CBS 200.50) TaxID=1284197 RepID=S8ADX6_DACHA|nr:hypothetical protein H072_4974 [Dactylellina haptotyla CBS 200.50]